MRGESDMAIVRCVVVLVVFLAALVAIDSGWKLYISHFGSGGAWNVQKTDKYKAEQVWVLCMKEFQEIPEDGASLDSHFRHPSKRNHSFIKSYNTLLAKRSLWEVHSYFLFQEKYIHLDCIREDNHPLHGLHNGDELESRFVSRWSRVPRRSLRYKKHKRASVRRPAPSPRLAARSPISAPVLAHQAHVSSHSPIPSQTNLFKPLAHSPKQKPLDKSRPFLVALHVSPRKPPNPPPNPPNALPKPPNATPKSPNALPKPPNATPKPPNALPKPPNAKPKPPSAHQKPKKATSSSSENNDRTYIIAAIAGCSTAAFAFVALFLICCLKKRDESVGQRDGRPLLKHSSGSSQSPQSIYSPGKHDSQALVSGCNLSVANSSSGTKTMAPEAAGAALVNQALPLPPGKSAPPPTGPSPPPVPPPPKPPAPKAPPPPKARPPPNPPKPGAPKSSPLGPHRRGRSSGSEGSETGESPKTKLKPFFWDKVNASPDHSMVWHEIKAGSFQFNEEMMESLFGYSPADQNKNERKKDSSLKSAPQYIQIIEAKKAQNLAILLKALNVTTMEVCDALKEGNELPPELIQTLLKMAPTADEELKLRLFAGDISQLGPADRFLKILIEIPFAFKRMESLLFMSNLQEEVSSIKESFATLEVACNELKNSRLFLKLLEAVLKTGNRMNNGTFRGGAQAFKLDTLLKLSDVKGTDGKTTLLHFVVQEIIRSEGVRAARGLKESHSMSSVKTEDLVEDVQQDSSEYYRNLGLRAVSGLIDELKNVKKAAVIDGDNLTQSVAKLGHSLLKAKDFLNSDMKSLEEESEFCETLSNFLEHTEEEVPMLLNQEQKIMALVKSTGDYFHGSSGKDEGLRLFVIVRDFLVMLDKVCKEVEKSAKSTVKAPRKELASASTRSSSQESQVDPLPDIRQQLFPAITARKMDDDFSSDDESSSP